MTLPEHHGGDDSAMLASNADRDMVTERLQAAFAEHRLTDSEFDERIRAALTARTAGELDTLTADLPAQSAAPVAAVATPQVKPGRFAVAFKSSISRSGRWSVPDRFYSLVYKGGGVLDLRAARLTAPVTTIMIVCYKSNAQVLVPPGVRVELGGTGVSLADDGTSTATGTGLAPRAPVVHVKGVTYKGTIDVRTKPAP
jgi:Domain of unknown function (DUF1707)